VERKLIFSNYAYASGTSNTLSRYFTWFAESLSKYLPQKSRILDIAANDGSLVARLESFGFDAVGIDPAKNVVIDAQMKGRNVIEGYWPQDAKRIERGFDAIICMNVLAHVDNPKEFLTGCKEYLNGDGIVIVQPSQARMFGNNEFDTCYHEHISFFNTNSIRVLAASVGLRLISAFFTKIHGDSCVYVLAQEGARVSKDIKNYFSNGEFSIIEDVFEYEDSIGLYEKQTYLEFARQSRNLLELLTKRVLEHKSNGYQIVFLGAAAKAMTVINAAGIEPDLFLDEAPLKIGRKVPGSRLLVQNLQALHHVMGPIFIVITAWNFKRELLGKIWELGLPKDTIYYCYFPAEEIGTIGDILN
jgi:SAM-dependent methyltransferase